MWCQCYCQFLPDFKIHSALFPGTDLPREHGTRRRCPQSQCGNLCSCPWPPLGSTSGQRAWGKRSRLASNSLPRTSSEPHQEPPPTLPFLKGDWSKINYGSSNLLLINLLLINYSTKHFSFKHTHVACLITWLSAKLMKHNDYKFKYSCICCKLFSGQWS